MTTAKDFITKDNFAKAEDSLSTEKEIVADFDAKMRSEIAKDEL